MSIHVSEKANRNYLAKIVSLGVPVKHPNANKLQGFIIDGSRIWVDLSRQTGDLGVYFPLECKLNEGLLSRLNLYRDETKNIDVTIKGYFESKGRVRAVKFRGEPSEGFFLTLEEVMQALGDADVDISNVGEEFDMWGQERICEKYIPTRFYCDKITRSARSVPKARKSRLKEGQFRFHDDTVQLRKNMHEIEPHDYVSHTDKLHGTSFVVSKILTQRKLTIWERILRWFGAKIQEEEYDTIYSSRGVIKNEYFDKINNHYYGVDLWGDIKDILHEKAIKGLTFYGEAVGYTSSGAAIQKGYDYGFLRPDGHGYTEGLNFGIYIYRITLTNVDGQKTELSWGQIKQYCDKYGIKHVPERYYGRAKDWRSDIVVDDNWRDNFLAALQTEYLEKDCHLCRNKVPGEGIVLRVDDLFNFKAYKLKSFRFLEKESTELDEGEIDIETNESTTEYEVGS